MAVNSSMRCIVIYFIFTGAVLARSGASSQPRSAHQSHDIVVLASPLPQQEPQAENLAGAWETEDPFLDRTEFGMFIKITANREAQFVRGVVVFEAPQTVMSFDGFFYQRTAGDYQIASFVGLPAGRDRLTSWDGQRLLWQDQGSGIPDQMTKDSLSVDITFEAETASWSGKYTRNGITKDIRLSRPGSSRKVPSTLLVGTWKSPNAHPIPNNCVVIAEGTDGALVGWRSGRTPIAVRPPLAETMTGMSQESDGWPLKVTLKNDSVTLEDEFLAGIAGSGPFRIEGSLSGDGTQILGTGSGAAVVTPPPGSYGAPPQVTLEKTEGGCFAGEP